MDGNNEPLKHLEIPTSRVEHIKKIKKPGFFPPFGFINEQRREFGEKLSTGLERVKEIDKQYSNALPAKFFKLTLRADLNFDAHAEKLEAYKIKWLNPLDKRTVIVSVSESGLEELKKKISIYTENGSLKTFFDLVEKIEPIFPNEKFLRLARTMNEEKDIVVDIDFYGGLNLEEYEKSVDFIRDVEKNQTVITNRIMNPESPFIRLKTKVGNLAKIASSVQSIRKIEEVPPFALTRLAVPKSTSVEFETPASDLERIMVIDSGVNNNHPGIRHVLLYRKNYIDGTGNAEDIESGEDVGHGTQVAGLAVYGQMPNTAKIKPTSTLGVAKIHDGVNNTPVEEMLEDIIKDGITKKFRIYTLTVMLPRQAFEISRLAAKIDEISRNYGIIFIISTGNLRNDELQGYYSAGLPYPFYLGEKDSRIYEGAEACCALTVGGIASAESTNSVAKKMQASPFTRAGPTPDGRLKPDLVHFAGNMSKPYNFEESLGITTLNNFYEKNLFSTSIGTSFSAPIVANLASQLLKEYKKASSNLVRALLVQSADISEYARLGTEPRFVYGHGFPNEYSAIYSSRFSPTLIYEGEVASDNIAKIMIPMPEELGDAKGSKFVKITLAYDPPVSYRNASLSYTKLDIHFNVCRKNGQGQFTTIASSLWKTRLYDEQDTIKKAIMHMVRKPHAGEDWLIEVIPRLKFGKKSPIKQKFALVVTIEDVEKNVDLYTPLSKKIESEKSKVQVSKMLTPQKARR